MKHLTPIIRAVGLGILAAGALAVLPGCSQEEETTAVDASAIEAAFGSPAETAPAEDAGAEESTTEAIRVPGDDGENAVSVQEVASRAATAIRKDDVAEAMVMLQTLRRARSLSPDQLTTVQDQMAALQSDLAHRAATGDQRAQQALQLIQQSTRW